MSDKDNPVTLKEWAYIAIAKHTRKMLKYRSKVIKDKDPEDLHQMRVGMRRLRSAIAGFTLAIDLPPTVSEKNIAKIGRSLGKLRDLDVLIAALANDYRSLLPPVEQKGLDKVLKSLSKQRKQELKQVQKTINSKLYLNLQQGLQNWLKQPKYKAIGECSIVPVLPDLLLPQISQLLLHPGWLVGIELNEGRIHFPGMLNQEAVEELLEQEDPILHDLRKLAKKTRYNLELFSQFYDDTYHYYVKQIEQIQEVLGQIQDCYVLKENLEKILKSAVATRMPTLANLLATTRYQKWQEWGILQRQFLEDQIRRELRQTIQQPIS
ncbi:CHAD domain-containing protein [Pleurocapsa sp. PCC 7319]|uniref:CHAD domain-containing protein n=1 Tax=Pleurocapsa sp. PCC 7319 TaxID=118161 RepID=UPI00034CEA31|nr:CHAD domain-containing protein [Pleurocapsa sp. PCC 7319]